MGLKADFDEVRAAWPSYPWRLRLWLVLSLFLASGSIASLSDTIFRWKGFVLDAIDFYAAYVSEPVRKALSNILSTDVPPNLAHILTLALLVITPNVRLILFRGASWSTRENALAGIFGTTLGLAYLYYTHGNNATLLAGAGGLFASTMYYAYLHVRKPGAARLLFLVYLIGPFVIVGLLAAVNAGLTR
jgi:hypothetical protein